jgi:hypothetical protein
MGNPLLGGILRPDGGQNGVNFNQSLVSGAALLSNWNLVDPVLQALNPTIDQFQPEIIKRIGDLVPLLAHTDLSGLLRALAADNGSAGSNAIAKTAGAYLATPALFVQSVSLAQLIDQNPATEGALSTFKTRLNAYEKSPSALTSTSVPALGRGLLDFFEEKPGQDVATETAIREFLAAQLEAGTFDQIVKLAGSDPEKSEQLLETFAAYASNGDIENFLAYIRRTVSGD